jgi:hypothetical protein
VLSDSLRRGRERAVGQLIVGEGDARCVISGQPVCALVNRMRESGLPKRPAALLPPAEAPQHEADARLPSPVEARHGLAWLATESALEGLHVFGRGPPCAAVVEPGA